MDLPRTPPIPTGTGSGAFDAGTAAAALAGLGQARKTLPARLFYDLEGCRLFGEITRLPEYYPTRTERALLIEIAPEVGGDRAAWRRAAGVRRQR